MSVGNNQLDTGNYELIVTSEDLQFSAREFTIKEGKKTRLQVSVAPSYPATYPDLQAIENRVAAWAMRNGATVVVQSKGLKKGFRLGQELPSQFNIFTIDRLHLDNARDVKELELLPQLLRLGSIIISGSAVNAHAMEKIAECKDVTYVTLSGSSIGDEEVASLLALQRLDVLNLHNTSITDRGLKILSEHPQISALLLDNNTKLTKTSIESIVRFRSLASMGLQHYPMDREILRRIAAMDRVWALDLAYSKELVTDDMIALLTEMPILRRLSLTDCNVGDGCVQHLAKIKKLDDISFRKTNLTDAGIRDLIPTHQFVMANFSMTQVSTEAVEEFARDHPKCRVIYGEDGSIIDLNADRE